MKILFSSRKTLFSVPGGDTVQLLKTAEYLRKLDISVDISTELEPDLAGYDLVHLFNLMRPQEVYLQAMNAKRQGKKIALSTIYGLYTEYEHKVRKGLPGLVARNISPWQIERLKVAARIVVNRELNKGSLYTIFLGYRNLCGQIAKMCDVFLPNSLGEMGRVHTDFPISKNKPFIVVPNAVDIGVFDQNRVVVSDAVKRFEGCVLSAARIEGRKCQLELVRAMKDLPYQLVLIGKPAPNHLAYFDAIKKESSDRVHFVGQVSHDELVEYYKVAKVHALVSWMETPGLSSLEAGAMGCNLVITEKGDTRDYFGDEAFYCDPESVASIKEAVIQAYNSPSLPALAQRIREDYCWQKTAEKTLGAYRIALGHE